MAERRLNYRINTQSSVTGLRQAEKAFRRLEQAVERAGLKNLQYAHTNKRAAAALKLQTMRARNLNRQLGMMNMVMRRVLISWGLFYTGMMASRGFKAAIAGSINFNKQIEQSKLGIAALITASARIEDPFGRAVDTARAFAFAQGEAARQVQQLRKDALATEATYEQLLETFQVAIAPGLAGGMALDEIRTFALRISQAATALAMPQRQLAEEIRSILQGSIRVQNTRIAAALGITNEHIRRWKQMGTLAQSLAERFEAFKESGKILRETFAGLSGRVADAFQQLVGEAGVGLFDELKSSLKEIFDLVVDSSASTVIIRPEAIALAQEFFEHIRNIVKYARQLGGALDYKTLKKTLDALGGTVEFIGKLFVDIGVGIGRALATLGAVANYFGNILGKAGDLRGAIGAIVSLLTELLVIRIVVTGITKSIQLMKLAVVGVKTAVIAVDAAFSRVMITATKLSIPLILIGTLVTLVNKIVQDIIGTDFSAIDQIAVAFRIAFNVVKQIGRFMTSLRGMVKAVGISISGSITVAYKAAAVAALYLVEKTLAIKAAATNATKDWVALAKVQETMAEYQKDLGKSSAQWAEESSNAWTDGLNQAKEFFTDTWDPMEGVDKIMEQGGAAAGKQWVGSFMDSIKGLGVEGIGGTLQKWLASARTQAAAATAAAGAGAGTGDKIGIDYKKDVQEIQDKLQPITISLQKQLDLHNKIRDSYTGRIAQLQNEIVGHQQSITAGEKVAKNTEDILVKRRIIANLQAEMPILLHQSAKQLDTLRAKTALLVAETEGGWGNSLRAISLNIAEGLPSSMELAISIMKRAIDSFASAVSSQIVDAFDPDSDGSASERFANFLKSMSKMIIQELIKIAVIKTAAMIGLSAAGGAHSGGRIGGRHNRNTPSMAHMLAPQGLAGGGRPAGLHPTDQIPIWAARGEFMMQVDSVRQYGASVMNAINQGLIDPGALKALAGVSHSPTSRAPTGKGYAEGGQVNLPESTESESSVTPAFIVANDDSMDRMLAGGKSAMLSFIQDNSPTISQLLKG